MKEASGELNLTLITVVAIGLIAALFAALWPTLKEKITSNWNDTSGEMEGLSMKYDIVDYIESELF